MFLVDKNNDEKIYLLWNLLKNKREHFNSHVVKVGSEHVTICLIYNQQIMLFQIMGGYVIYSCQPTMQGLDCS